MGKVALFHRSSNAPETPSRSGLRCAVDNPFNVAKANPSRCADVISAVE